MGKSPFSCFGLACRTGRKLYDSDSDDDDISPRGPRDYQNPGGRMHHGDKASSSIDRNQAYPEAARASTDYNDFQPEVGRKSSDLSGSIADFWRNPFSHHDEVDPSSGNPFPQSLSLPDQGKPIAFPNFGAFLILESRDEKAQESEQQLWSTPFNKNSNLHPLSRLVVNPDQEVHHCSREGISRARHTSGNIPHNLPKPPKNKQRGSSSKGGHSNEHLPPAEF